MRILLLFLLIHTSLFSQIKISGIILDNNSILPIEYVNIGVPQKGVGTISNDKGEFELVIPKELVGHTLILSHIGYESISVKIANHYVDANSRIKFYLNPISIELNSVTVSAEKEIKLGYKPQGSTVKGYFEAKGLGAEGGSLIKNNLEVLLTEFNMNISKFTFDTLKFRLNFYTVRRNKPNEKINKQDIYFIVSESDIGLFSIPIQNDGVVVNKDFFCTIELLEISGQKDTNAEFLFSAIQNKNGITTRRLISLGEWEKFKGYSICFWLSGKEIKIITNKTHKQ